MHMEAISNTSQVYIVQMHDVPCDIQTPIYNILYVCPEFKGEWHRVRTLCILQELKLRFQTVQS